MQALVNFVHKILAHFQSLLACNWHNYAKLIEVISQRFIANFLNEKLTSTF